MKHLPLTALAFLVSFPASSFASIDNYKVLGDYKDLAYWVETPLENSSGITREDFERTLKLRLMRNGIRPIPLLHADTPKQNLLLVLDILDVEVGGKQVGVAVGISIKLVKVTQFYASPAANTSSEHLPISFPSALHENLILTRSKAGVLEAFENDLDKFILAYLEANME